MLIWEKMRIFFKEKTNLYLKKDLKQIKSVISFIVYKFAALKHFEKGNQKN